MTSRGLRPSPRGYCGPLHRPPHHHPLHRLARDCGDSVEVGVVVEQEHSGGLGGRRDDQVRNRHAVLAAQGQQSLNLDDGLLGAVFPSLGRRCIRAGRFASAAHGCKAHITLCNVRYTFFAMASPQAG